MKAQGTRRGGARWQDDKQERPMRKTSDPRPPTGTMRLLFRLPNLLYQLRLGWLLGGRFVLIDYVGRVSGRRRRVVLEVVEHDAGTYIIVSGYGTRSSWYRSLRANPAITITVGWRRMPADAELAPPAEGGEILLRYAKRHPRAIRSLTRFTGMETDGSDADYELVGQRLPFFRLVPRG